MVSQTLSQPKPASIVQAINQFLFEPHQAITSAAERRSARLLIYFTSFNLFAASISLLLLTAPRILALTTDPSVLQSVIEGVISEIVAIGIYVPSRMKPYRIGAGALVAYLYLISLLPLLAPGGADLLNAATILIYASLMAAIWLPFRTFLGYMVLAIGTALYMVWGFTAPSSQIAHILTFVSLLITMIISTYHRNNLELDRQAELRLANEALRASEAVLEQRVAERTHELNMAKEQAETERAAADQARVRAEKADQVKSQFLASMSHELRTPLNAILTFNQLMAMGKFGSVNSEQEEFLNQSLNSGRHLLSLINDILDVTKIQSGMLKLFVESDFDVAKEMEAVRTTAENILEGKPVTLIANIDQGFPPLICDKRRVRQILLNLVSNAAKFTEQGTITLSANQQGDHVLFVVRDTGPGIAPEQQEAIFEPFIQTEAGITHAGGTGLGLPITKSLVKAHSGRIWVESAEGQGSAFHVLLPLKPALELGEVEI